MNASEDILIADKLLFAVDLVDHVIIKTRPSFGIKTADILERVDRLRNCTYSRFNKTMKKALHIIDVNQDGSVFNDFQKMMDQNIVNKQTFIEYAKSYREHNLDDGFHPKSFLMYCDRVANMAGYFLSYGVEDAPDVAVESIMQAFPQCVMYSEHWNMITEVAEVLEALGNDYYGDLSSDSTSDSNDQSENEDSSTDSVNMDVNVSSPEDISHQNLDIASSILNKTSRNMDVSGPSLVNVATVPKSCLELVEAMNSQSSDSAYSSIVSSIKYSSNDASPASPEGIEMSNNGS